MRPGTWLALAALVAFMAYALRQARAARPVGLGERGPVPRREDKRIGARPPPPSIYHEGDPSVRH